jgi:Galactose-3-O-sulfotransferase
MTRDCLTSDGLGRRAAAPLVVFTHVPKTSGTSFRQSLVEPNVAAGQIYRYAGARRFLRERGFERGFVWGHIPLGIHLLTRREVAYVCFLRDPVDRAVSYYYFVKDSDPAVYKHPMRDEADALSIVEFYRRRKFQNWQTRFMAGMPFHYLYPRLPSLRFERATLRRAISNLTDRYACFGVQERFEESLDLIQLRLGWQRRTVVAPQKKTGKRPALTELDDATRSALREANALDCELYDLAIARFDLLCRASLDSGPPPSEAAADAAGAV